MKKIAILASGEGTNAERIIRYFLEKRTAEVVLVITNKAQAGVLKRAERLSVPSLILTAQEFASGKALEALHLYNIDFIVLAGFLLKVPDTILHDYPNKIVNIHPALLPKFGGKGMYARDSSHSTATMCISRPKASMCMTSLPAASSPRCCSHGSSRPTTSTKATSLGAR